MHLSTKVRWNIRPKKNQKNKRNVLPLLTLGERRSSNNYCVIIGQCRLNYFVGFHSYGVCVNRFLACQKYYAPLKYFIQKTRYPSVTGRYWFDLETGQYRVLAPVPPRKSIENEFSLVWGAEVAVVGQSGSMYKVVVLPVRTWIKYKEIQFTLTSCNTGCNGISFQATS